MNNMGVLIMTDLGLSASRGLDEFDVLREKYIETLTGGNDFDINAPYYCEQIVAITNAAQWCRKAMNKEPDRAYIWADLSSATSSSHINGNFNRIWEMALAYKTKGSQLNGDKELLADIISALLWLNINRYNKEMEGFENWWSFEIGIPLLVNSTLCVLYNELPDELIKSYTDAIGHFVPDPTKNHFGRSKSTGANRVWLCNVTAIRGIISKDGNLISTARDSLTPVFLYVMNGDGFYEDGSFIQHGRFAYTGGYGIALIGNMAQLMYLLNNSAWDIVAPTKSNVYRWIYDSFEPFVFKGFFMDMARGREMSRYQTNGNDAGRSLMRALVMLSQIAPNEDRAAFGGMVKAWSEQNACINFYKSQSIFIISKARELLEQSSPNEKNNGIKFSPSMDRVVLNRDGFALGLAMYSKRTASYESINRENLKGFYTAAGALYLHNQDFAKFADDYWATVDSYRLPGASAIYNKPIATEYGQSFAGGASLNDLFGVAGFVFMPKDYGFLAKKSYFMFEDEIVALGTVNSSEIEPVETTIENYKINGDNVLTINGEKRATEAGKTDVVPNARWMHLKGNVCGSDVGFYMPEATDVHALRETRNSDWNSVNKMLGNANGKAECYLTLWLDHGAMPNNKNYAYVILPNKSAEEVLAYANNPNIEVLANNELVQALREHRLGITAANFFEAAEVAGIGCNTCASVIMQEAQDSLQIAVADPTQENKDAIIIEIDKSALASIQLDQNVAVLSFAPKLVVSIDTKMKRGMTTNMKFKLKT